MSTHYATKLVVLVRRDLRNAKGEKVKSAKLGVQIAHASMAWLGNRFRDCHYANKGEVNEHCLYKVWLTDAEENWLVNGSFAKIALGVDDEPVLRAYCLEAISKGLNAEIITDAGHTEFGGVPTVTCAGIGPGPSDVIDTITGHLRPL